MSTWYDENPNWVVNAVTEALLLEKKSLDDNIQMTKIAEPISIGSGAIIGGLAAAGLTSAGISAKKDQEYKTLYGNAVAKILNEQNKRLVDMNSNYYSQIENINRDLKVVFSPFSVAFMLKNTVIDTISVDTMNATMKDAWRRKDQNYFKNLIVNKIYLESQLAEQMFIKRLIENDHVLKRSLFNRNKIEPYEPNEMEINSFILHPIDELEKVSYFIDLFEKAKDNEAIHKYANTLISMFLKEEPIDIHIDIDGIKYAEDDEFELGFTKVAFLGLFEPRDRDIITPRRIISEAEVSFLPDRVLYILDNIVITQLTVFNMNEEAYEQFTKKNSKYFKNFFIKETHKVASVTDDLIKEALDSSERETLDLETVQFEKVASFVDRQNLFLREDIHPMAYFIYMNKEFGEDWLTWDYETLRTMLITNYDLDNVNQIALDKLMFIIVAYNSDTIFDGFHTLEKAIRVFNGRHIDFEERESNLSLPEIVFALRFLSDLLADQDDNIYDNFNDHTFSYLVEVLADNDYRVCAHKARTQKEKDFWDLVNVELLEDWSKALPKGLFDNDKGGTESLFIQKLVKRVCDKYNPKDTEDIDNFVKENNPHSGDNADTFSYIIKYNIQQSFITNSYIEGMDKLKEDQTQMIMSI